MGIFARSGRSLAVLGVVALSSFMLAGPQSYAEDPPGNNGTVKIDGVAFGDVPNNEPHPGCIFEVDFYGFDEGDLNATVRFFAIPPTGQRELLLADTVFIGEDSNAGGGSEEGLDATREYNLQQALKTYMAHPEQGFHIKLKVNAPGSIGKDTKYKVFWVEECAYSAPA